jgi:predicted metal-dependent HD superfamily phosphohydrolase
MMPPDRHTADVDLAGEWAATLRRVGAGTDPADSQRDLGRLLLARYAEPHRHYHTLDHLAAVLSTVTDLAPYADEPDVVRLAAWYHDTVYDPRRADNEERSAELAERELGRAGLTPATAARVAGLVRLTAGHDAPAGDRDAEVLCDADLAILASPAAGYDRYAAAVRREYAHVGDDAWRLGRAAVLHGLIALPRLFRTPPARTGEPAARDNLRRELAALDAPSGAAGRRG